MAHYAIGDIQGCFDELELLLAKLNFNHGTDTLWLVGDIVNRGPKSLEALQFCMQHPSSVQIVLGNHDLHLLAIAYGFGKIKRSDTIKPILNHPECHKMIDWLRRQPLLVPSEKYVMVHAGILPQWNIAQAQSLAQEVEAELQSNSAEAYFANMYGNKPSEWHESLQGHERLRMITNVFTRMRALTFDNALDYDFKGDPAHMPSHLRPWFEAPNRAHLSHTIVFGHWSALGYSHHRHVISLDTGALWGGKLTAINLQNHEICQVASLRGLDWKKTLV